MMKRRLLFAVGAIAVVAIAVAACGASSTGTSKPPGSSAPSAKPVANAPCTRLNGRIDPDGTCHVHNETPTYTLDFRLPLDYPDIARVTDDIAQRRDEFVDWLKKFPVPGGIQSGLHIDGTSYQSASTRSLVLTVGTEGGVHPVTTYDAFNYDVDKKHPITFDTLFKPGARPLGVLNAAVQHELDKRQADDVSAADSGADAYQNFAITDDSLIFFINQDGPFPHYLGSLEVPVPRSELAPLLAGSDSVMPCTSGQVAVTAEQPQAAMTHRSVTLAFGLAPGAGSCTLTGYPGVDTGAGGPLLHAGRLPRGYMGGLPAGVAEPPTVTLTASGPAHAVVESLATDTSGDQCPTYTDLRVTAPDTTETSTVATEIEACELIVHPVT